MAVVVVVVVYMLQLFTSLMYSRLPSVLNLVWRWKSPLLMRKHCHMTSM